MISLPLLNKLLVLVALVSVKHLAIDAYNEIMHAYTFFLNKAGALYAAQLTACHISLYLKKYLLQS